MLPPKAIIVQPLFTKIAKFLSIGLFLIALTQPCFDTDSGPGEMGEGAALLISGFFGFFSSLTGLIWLANPALFASWLYSLKKPETSFILSLIAVIIALLFLKCDEIIANEGGTHYNQIEEYRLGYWLWLLSTVAMLTSNVYLVIKPKSNSVNLK